MGAISYSMEEVGGFRYSKSPPIEIQVYTVLPANPEAMLTSHAFSRLSREEGICKLVKTVPRTDINSKIIVKLYR
jgi:hypothetical protein